MKRLLALALVLGLLSPLALASTAVAATTYTDSVRGVEIFQGVVIRGVRYGVTFVGRATGALPGVVSTSINYSPPNPGMNVTNTVVSGKWALAVIENGVFRGNLFGAVVPGGTAVWDGTGATATVNLTLTITGGTREFAGASGGGSFGGFLSHLTFPPTFGGTLTLTTGAGDVTPPIITDARRGPDTPGSSDFVDAGESFSLTFSEVMNGVTTGNIGIRDLDGTTAQISCGAVAGPNQATCSWNTAVTTVTVTLTGTLATIDFGSVPGMSIPFNITALTGFSDLQGNVPNLGSGDTQVD